ncbi:MAG TPA: hypothetical protein VMT19_12880 [Thermoanaerobaculaceae bacterium]|nr:hypothetical protein [Thermoanaerobaculaceae bacterium]
MSARKEVPGVAALGLIGVLVCASTAAQEPSRAALPDDATPVTILRAMEKVYAGCRSYRDTGEVTSAIVTDGGRAGSDRPFTTAFVRPGRFRFQFTDTGLGDRSSSYIVWSDGSEVRSWWDAKPGVRRPGSLVEALTPATGISGGSSVRVPALLMPGEMSEGPLLVAPERIDDGSDRGVACLRIRGASRKTPYTLPMGRLVLTVRDETVTLWIDRSTLLLRKVEERRTLDTYTSDTTTTYTPEIDVEIPAAQLAFGAPAPATAPPR